MSLSWPIVSSARRVVLLAARERTGIWSPRTETHERVRDDWHALAIVRNVLRPDWTQDEEDKYRQAEQAFHRVFPDVEPPVMNISKPVTEKSTISAGSSSTNHAVSKPASSSSSSSSSGSDSGSKPNPASASSSSGSSHRELFQNYLRRSENSSPPSNSDAEQQTSASSPETGPAPSSQSSADPSDKQIPLWVPPAEYTAQFPQPQQVWTQTWLQQQEYYRKFQYLNPFYSSDDHDFCESFHTHNGTTFYTYGADPYSPRSPKSATAKAKQAAKAQREVEAEE